MEIKIPNDVSYIIKRLTNAGFEAYAVGGCTRDLFLGKEPYDWDITTSALPEKIIELFSKFKIATTGIKHGTVTVIINHSAYEITTYRKDGEYSDNRRPDKVEFSTSLTDDLSRRDFTMNAIAYNPEHGICDSFNGLEDIKNRTIRAIGDPDLRFNEDALRILRALRFSAVLGFEIEENTAESILKNKALLNNISKERIMIEFNKLVCGDYAYEILSKFRDVIAEFIPEIVSSFDFDQHNPHHCFDVWEHSLVALRNIESDKILRLTMLFHDLGKPHCLKFDSHGIGHFKTHNIKSAELARTALKRLKYDRKTINEVTWLVYHHDDKLKTDRQSIKRYINRDGAETLIQLIKVQLADNSAKSEKRSKRYINAKKILETIQDICEKQECCTVSQLEINGGALISLGLRRGEVIGEILNELLELVICEKCENTEIALISRAKELIRSRN